MTLADAPNSAASTQDGVDEPASGSAERSLRLLALLADEGRPMSLAELTNQLALPKGTVHRLCTNLIATGHLSRDVDERMLTVGPALRQLAFNTLNHATLSGMRHAVLKDLCNVIGETCNFTTLDGSEAMYLDRVEAKWPLRLTIDVGAHVPLHCTAAGKTLLAFLPKRQRDAMIKRIPLPRLTSATITTPQALREECDAIVRSGFACDREEFVAGLIGIAVPVRDSQGDVRATVSFHAPTARVSIEQAEQRVDVLNAAAGKMSKLI